MLTKTITPNEKELFSSSADFEEEEVVSIEKLKAVWAKRAYQLAQEPEVEATGQTLDLLVFRLGHERYGINVLNVREIYPLEQFTPVPRTPNFVAGVFSARGRILSVIDLHAFLGMPPQEYKEDAKIIVVTNTNPSSEMTNLEIGILANEIENVITIFKDDIDPALITRSGGNADYIQGVTNDLLEVLDLDVLLENKRLIVNDEAMWGLGIRG